MKVRQYLEWKYNTTHPTVITKKEAKICRVPWPLRPGWLKRHGDNEITLVQVQDMRAVLEKRYRNQIKNGSKHAASITDGGLRALERMVGASVSQKAPPSKDSFLESYEWRRLRMQALKLHGAACQCCGATRSDGIKLHVDHIKPRRLFPQLALDIDNLQVLCEVCNQGKGNWDTTDWRGDDKIGVDEVAHLRAILGDEP